MRLHIRGVYRVSPAYLALNSQGAAAASDYGQPSDPPYEINEPADDRLQAQAIAAHKPIFLSTPIPLPSDDKAPANPAHARVYVLTNYACPNACIGFVDELKQFPSVRQIGLPTAVDSRSGTAVAIKLPSGRATAMIASMTRDGRSIRAEIEIVANARKANHVQPDYRVLAGDVEIGAAWNRHSDISGRDYVSLSLAAPEFGPRRLYANLGRVVGSDDRDLFAIIWIPAD